MPLTFPKSTLNILKLAMAPASHTEIPLFDTVTRNQSMISTPYLLTDLPLENRTLISTLAPNLDP